MYNLKPVFSIPLELKNTCTIYKLKNLQGKITNVLNKSKNTSNEVQLLSDDGVEVLLKNQHAVLNILEDLEFRLNKLNFKFSDSKSSLPISEDTLDLSMMCHDRKKYHKKNDSEINTGIKNLIKTDTVVFADPESPPYSLLALPILWHEMSWDISYHVHSSITNDFNALKTIEVFTNVSSKYNDTTIKVFVIWQHTKPNPKIVRSSTDTLFGEVQLLRLFNHHLATETLSLADQTNSDKVLDLINEINCSTNDRTSELSDLINDSNTILNLENIAVWSSLYKNNNFNSSPNIKKWVEQMTQIIIC